MIRRLLMTTDTVGGVWHYSMELCRYLSDAGITVCLATMGRLPADHQRQEAANIPGLTLEESNYKLEWMPDPWTDIDSAGSWLLQLSQIYRPDVVHLNGYCHAVLDWGCPTLVVCHSCVLSWWEAVRKGPAPSEWARYACQVRRGLCAGSAIVAPTHDMLSCAQRLYGPFEEAAVIPNARNFAAFSAGPKEPFVFAAGRLWDEAKNLQALCGAAPHIQWPVYVAGEGCTEGSLQGLGFLPTVDMASWLRRAGIYALPAKYEPFGLSILEAALSGCALVLGDIPSLRENWSGCAIFVDPNDPDQLADALNELIDNEWLRLHLSAKARTRGESFSLEAFGSAYIKAYEVLQKGESWTGVNVTGWALPA